MTDNVFGRNWVFFPNYFVVVVVVNLRAGDIIHSFYFIFRRNTSIINPSVSTSKSPKQRSQTK